MGDQGSNRSISVGGNVKGSVLQTGDGNTANVQYTKTTLPPAESVDIKSELAALRELLAQLNAPDSKKIDRAAEAARTLQPALAWSSLAPSLLEILEGVLKRPKSSNP